MSVCKAYRVFSEDGKIVSRIVEMPTEELSAGEVTIRAQYSSLNYKDMLATTGAGKIMRKFPLNAGIDVAGVVESSLDGRFSAGDAVLVTGYDLGVAHDGGLATYVRVPANWVVRLPAGLTTYDAMAIGTAGFTAALSVVRLEQNGLVPDAGPVIVTGATGGVGSLAVEFLSGLGYKVTALSGKDDRHDWLKSIGAAEVLALKGLELGTKPLEKTMWAGAVDPVGGDVLSWLTRTMMYGGSIANSGLAGGTDIKTTVLPFILRGVNLLGIDSVACPMPARLAVWHRLASDMKPRHTAAIVKTIGLSEIPAAVADIQQRRSTGRFVVDLSR